MTMTGLTGPGSAKEFFLIFYSDVVDGRMWCPVRFNFVASLETPCEAVPY